MRGKTVKCQDTGFSQHIPPSAADADGEAQVWCPECGEAHMMPVVVDA